jgi:hypothetical protein
MVVTFHSVGLGTGDRHQIFHPLGVGLQIAQQGRVDVAGWTVAGSIATAWAVGGRQFSTWGWIGHGLKAPPGQLNRRRIERMNGWGGRNALKGKRSIA